MIDNNNRRLMVLQFLSGSMAACGAVTFTNPFDVLKTRRQLHNELCKTKPDIFHSTISIQRVWQAEGLKGLQKGLVSAYIYQMLMNGTRFMVYEPVRLLFIQQTGFPSSSLACNATAGAIAGGIAAIVASPFNLIKTRLQSFSSHFSTGYQHGYSGVKEAMLRIFRSEGISGFYKGVGASVSRTTIGSAVQLSSYDWCKSWISSNSGIAQSSFFVHFGAAMGSGVLACLVMNPFDVIMTRLYNQKGETLYRGLRDCAIKTVRTEGPVALWKGLIPHFIRIGPHTVLTLVLLEQIRSLLRPLLHPSITATASTL